MAITRNWKICKSRIVGNTIVMLNVNFVTLCLQCQILIMFWNFIYWYFGSRIDNDLRIMELSLLKTYDLIFSFISWVFLWKQLLYLFKVSYVYGCKWAAPARQQFAFFIYKDKSLRRRVLGLTVKILSHDTHKM